MTSPSDVLNGAALPPITADMLIRDILVAHPHAASVFERNGLACPQCLAAGMETLSAVAGVHELCVTSLLEELNELVSEEGVSRT